jgi:hypothetical protein
MAGELIVKSRTSPGPQRRAIAKAEHCEVRDHGLLTGATRHCCA